MSAPNNSNGHSENDQLTNEHETEVSSTTSSQIVHQDKSMDKSMDKPADTQLFIPQTDKSTNTNGNITKSTEEVKKDKKTKGSGKGPGHPRKESSLVAINVSGVVDEPYESDSVVEFDHNNPMTFKKIFATIYKAYGISDIIFQFAPDSIKIESKSLNNNGTTLHTDFQVNLVKKYYCKEKIMVCVDRTQLEKIFKHVEKACYLVKFILKEDSCYSKMTIRIYNNTVNDISNYEIQLGNTNKYVQINDPDESTYPINFELPSKYFKGQIIKNIESTLVETFQFEKNNFTKQPIKFIYSDKTQQNKLLCEKPITDEKLIKLVNKLADDDFLVVSIALQDIKPFANAYLGDFIRIYVDKTQRLCLSTFIDKVKINRHDKQEEGFVCEMKLYTDLSRK